MRRVAKALAAQGRELAAELAQRRGDRALSAARDSLAADLGREVTPAEAADVLAQAVVCAGAILAGCHDSVAVRWLCESACEWEQWILAHAAGTQYSVLSTSHQPGWCHFYEQFLHAYDPTSRKRHGVFFTPQPIADYIVRQIDHVLTHEFNLPDGLASQSAIRNPKSEIILLDPACGTGVFVLAVIDHLHRRLGSDWNDFVPNLLPRLTGIELLPVPALLAKLNIVLKLAATGYDFRQPGRIDVRLGDALDPKPQSAIRNPQSTLPLILGNPPFSSLSTNTNPWIAGLVRGNGDVRGYVQAGDARLGERKTWLHDDYVKFIRLAQWHVEEAGQGIVGFVTNRGYLENATFRLMRSELARVFPSIRLVDLHGSRKGGDVAPDGSRDENVFGLDQGVAIGIFSRPPTPTRSVSEGVSHCEYAELWGASEQKIAALRSSAQTSLTLRLGMLAPQPPHWLFVPTNTASHPEYAAAWSLADAMPVNTTAPVTARDHFVVAFTREELCQRIAEFRELSISDETIRQKYFTRTRSSRYPTGDTRGWKLSEARRAVAADPDWQAKIARCLYRPFDWRYVFWHPAMIDWPRNNVTRHLIEDTGDRGQETGIRSFHNPQPAVRNLCLIARRQQLPGRPCTFFWIADGLALDGVIRSDNRGSESLFPLWLTSADGTRQANFAPGLLDHVASQLGRQPATEELFKYIYALFHSSAYRQKYAAQLRVDFPRILIPNCSDVFAEFARWGQQLIELHLLREVDHGSPCPPSGASRPFLVGGYYVLKKWVQPKHRNSGDAQYHRIVSAVLATQRITAEIDDAARDAFLDMMD